jgi:hypothetical protein
VPPSRPCARQNPRTVSNRPPAQEGGAAAIKPSPRRATRSSAAGLNPPKSTSGPQGRVGAGPIGPTPSPCGSPGHRRRITAIRASRRRARVRLSVPAARWSSSRPPTPRPRTRRPSVATSPVCSKCPSEGRSGGARQAASGGRQGPTNVERWPVRAVVAENARIPFVTRVTPQAWAHPSHTASGAPTPQLKQGSAFCPPLTASDC